MPTAKFSARFSARPRALTPPPGEPGEFELPYGEVQPGMRLRFDSWSADVRSAAILAGWVYLEICADAVGQVVTVRRRPDQRVRCEWIPPPPPAEPDDLFTL
jgi:hypothetical protein